MLPSSDVKRGKDPTQMGPLDKSPVMETSSV
jgi:hypothetical protein